MQLHADGRGRRTEMIPAEVFITSFALNTF